MNVWEFLDAVRINANRVQAYEKGRDGSDGKCDCIGLIVGAVKLAGEKWPGSNGSNWTARNAVDGLRRVNKPEDVDIGDLVFKAREPGDDGYALPASYSSSPDRRDYYHVGVVTGMNPLEITHCTSVPGGIKRDNTLGKWRFAGRLKMVSDVETADAGEPAESPCAALYTAAVTAATGKTVNLRQEPDKASKLLEQVPIGAAVDVVADLGEWLAVIYQGKRGYMMAQFLAREGKPDGPARSCTVDQEEWTAVLQALRRALDALDRALAAG